ncbi:MAG: glycosyltransferase family 4 protein, partial [bacterium]
LFQLKKIVKNKIKMIQPQIIHSHGLRPDIINSNLSGHKRVSTLHNYPFEDYILRYGKFVGNIALYTHMRALKKLDHVTVVSGQLAERLSKNLKCTPIPNGVNINLFKPVKNKEKIRKELNLPVNKKIFIYVGHLAHLKDPLTIVSAFNSLNSNFVLLLLGRGELESNIKQNITNENIHLLGFKSEIHKYLQAADYFVFSSLSEGFGLVTAEAMACGLPVILSNIPAHNEFFKYKKSIGLSFEKQNIKDLNQKIHEIIERDYNELSLSSRKIVELYFSSEKMVKNYEKIYIS